MIKIKTIVYWAVFVSLLILVALIVVLPLSEVYQEYSHQTTLKEDSHLKIENNVIFLDGREVYRFVPVDGGEESLGAMTPFHIGKERGMAYLYTRKHIQSFLIGETPVTMELWEYVMYGKLPEISEGLYSYPSDISNNDWFDFVKKLSKMTGREFRLPTKDEWEFAARGGIHSKHFKYAGSDNIDVVAYYEGNFKEPMKGGYFAMGKKKMPNELGLYDMCGSVEELTTTHVYEIDSQVKLMKSSFLADEKLGKDFYEGYVAMGGCYRSTAEECQLDHLPPVCFRSGARLVLNH